MMLKVFEGHRECNVFQDDFAVTHLHGSARVFWRRRSKSMENAKIRPHTTPKPLYRSSQKLACVITLWTAPGMKNFVAIVLGVFAPQIRNFDVLQGVTSF